MTESAVPPTRLQDGEQVLMTLRPSALWTAGFYVFTLGLWAIWRRRHCWVLTNRRIIAVKGVIGHHEKVLPLERIQDVSMSASPVTGGSIIITTAGGAAGIARIGPLTRAQAYELSDAIQAAQKAAAPVDGL